MMGWRGRKEREMGLATDWAERICIKKLKRFKHFQTKFELD
jgi:hypothetical protein